MMVVCESRQTVLEFANMFRSLDKSLHVYGAFSGSLETEGQTVEEEKYNKLFFEKFPGAPHKKADVLVVCNRCWQCNHGNQHGEATEQLPSARKP